MRVRVRVRVCRPEWRRVGFVGDGLSLRGGCGGGCGEEEGGGGGGVIYGLLGSWLLGSWLLGSEGVVDVWVGEVVVGCSAWGTSENRHCWSRGVLFRSHAMREE